MSEVLRVALSETSVEAPSSEPALCEGIGQDIQGAFQAVDEYCAQEKRLGLRERLLARIAARRVGKAGRALGGRRGKRAPEVGADSVIRMRGALDGVDGRTREVFRMYRLEGMTYPQISWRTGLTTSAIERYVASALVTLAGAMDEG